jgi:hypothetical protein
MDCVPRRHLADPPITAIRFPVSKYKLMQERARAFTMPQHEIRQQLGSMTDDKLADWMAETGNNNQVTARAEFLRRQTALQREATQDAKGDGNLHTTKCEVHALVSDSFSHISVRLSGNRYHRAGFESLSASPTARQITIKSVHGRLIVEEMLKGLIGIIILGAVGYYYFYAKVCKIRTTADDNPGGCA